MQSKLVDLGFGMARITGSPTGRIHLVISTPASAQDGVYEPAQSVSLDITPERLQDFCNALADASK